MRIRHYAQGKFYTIECPDGSSVVRRQGSDDHLMVPLNGQEFRIPADPPELLPLLAESGNFGVSLVGKPEPEVGLDGVSCPGCGQDDVTWLQLRDGSESVRCDACGTDFELPSRPVGSIMISRRTEG
jgi:LSD1 subclass zinc finger protein